MGNDKLDNGEGEQFQLKIPTVEINSCRRRNRHYTYCRTSHLMPAKLQIKVSEMKLHDNVMSK